MIGEVRLDPAGQSRRFIASISPPEYGPLAGDEDHTLEFTIEFAGTEPCAEDAKVFEGLISVEVDGVFIASKRLQVCVRRPATSAAYNTPACNTANSRLRARELTERCRGGCGAGAKRPMGDQRSRQRRRWAIAARL
jgi:hypothetical protein